MPVIASTVDGFAPRVMDSATDLTDAYAVIAEKTHCDLRLSDGTEFGSCIDNHNSRLEGIARHDGYDEHRVWGKMRRAYLAKEFVTVPFARGDLLVLARFCTMCLSYFLVINGVDPRECRIEAPYTDGFAPYAFKPLTPMQTESDSSAIDQDD
ncbi:hypothetical protein [Mycobacterium sp. NPDC006124]|uniref:hypothetical protein n=1 Tax=Mycobacterium sp. NPDC006124 TaxID=3156729 RepID=UPI0033B220E6